MRDVQPNQPTAARSVASDMILPLAIISVVAMMVFPLPLAVLDALLVINIAASVALLVASAYLSEPERFTTLPTILLLSTLFRLGLNVSTTRQLLATGSAPEVVRTFGEFVVAGNLVVGAVVFLIITIVQFLVIAKGAERVAEVAARFTLDAMPGRQMAIDADIRAGALTLVEARLRRYELQRESKLYGALDGAMKFVKGDAIAGLLITCLNMVAGLIVGVTQHGLGIAEALSRYTLFTVGDGLVSQVPALLISVAAGIAVTRVGDSGGRFAGGEIVQQLSREPQTMAACAIVFLGLAAIPGFPAWICILLTLCCLRARGKRRKQIGNEELANQAPIRPTVGGPLRIEVGSQLAARLAVEGNLITEIQSWRVRAFSELGVIVPEPEFSLQAGEANASSVKMRLRAKTMVDTSISIEGGPATAAIVHGLQQMLSAAPHLFLDDTATRILLDTHATSCEDLINSVVPNVVSVTELTMILKSLIFERISIREMPLILQALAEFPTRVAGERHENHDSSAVFYREHSASALTLPSATREKLIWIRLSLGSGILDRHSTVEYTDAAKGPSQAQTPRLLRLEAATDAFFDDAARHNVPIHPHLIQSLHAQLLGFRESFDSIAIVCRPYARMLLASIVQPLSFHCPVFTYGELASNFGNEWAGELTAVATPLALEITTGNIPVSGGMLDTAIS